ncbi:tldc domain-containing protein [Stylonychia lemnae]|uniref:Tldc domain-containing protein n=1 Tax=Stylonychia lemnae TaxID=5949 RepID=A0A078AVI2_STYLE|nr:tldc domain-containing protein [Stylonychia lemnae]|eukprot:CDW86071.1 tldc domain-containing protein [Stylonychia lemnae]
MQQNFYEIFTCLGCNKLYNIEERKPLELPCGDMICQQCYKKYQVKKKQIKCPYDNTHLCAIDEPVFENKFLIRNLQKQNFYLINCSEHQDIQAQVYCKLRNKIICTICMIVDPHLKCLEDGKTHLDFERKPLENAFQKVLPYFYDQIEYIKNLIHNVNAFVYKEREFNVVEIEKIINKSCQILQLSPINDDVKIKLRENTDILNFITNFTLIIQIMKDNCKFLFKAKKILKRLTFKINQQCIIFRRLVDFQLDVKQQPKLFKINGICKLIYKASRDGFKAINFHQKCDNQGPNISFIQSEHGEVFGGYTSLSWTSPDSGLHLQDNDAFLFSLSKNTLHKQYQNFDKAVRCNKDYLMEFGQFGYDICICNDCNHNSDSSCSLGDTFMPPQGFKKGDQFSKEYLGGSYNFKVIEMEVYSVTI